MICPFSNVWNLFRVLAVAGALAFAGTPTALAQEDTSAAQQGPYTDVWSIPTPSLYGGVGLLDMRNARFMPDGYFWIGGALKSPDDRIDVNFQPTPWLESTFRFTVDYGIPPEGQRAFYKYSLDWKARIFQETLYTPQVALGMQDFIGLGLFSAEYLVASKRFGPLDLTLGVGWGRLASRPAFENPFCAVYSSFCVRPQFIVGTSGGTPSFTSYFRGPNVGVFGGVEYKTPVPKLTVKLEYSSDAYTRESNYLAENQTHFINYAPFPVNVGLSYRFWNNVDVGVAYMYGRAAALNIDIITNPSEPNWAVTIDPQPPFVTRPHAAVAAAEQKSQTGNSNDGLDEGWRTRFVDLTQLPAIDERPPDPAMAAKTAGSGPAAKNTGSSRSTLLADMQSGIEAQGLRVDSIGFRKDIVRVEIENSSYLRDAEAISRTVRVLSAIAPADINVFEVTTAFAHVPLTTVSVPRTQIDALGEQTGTPAELWTSSVFSDASPSTRYGPVQGYPRLLWSLFPAIREQLFDPNNPVYIGLGLGGSSHIELLPGLSLDGEATYGLWDDFGNITRKSNSLLPHVRSDVVDYLQHGFTGINNLTMSYYSKPAPEIYARVTAGYIEDMFGGYGGEVLYRPYGQRWAVGADLYEAYQRNWDELFGFGHYNYHVLTGHASLYVETPWNETTAVVSVGRYLAGDYGGTLELYRRFDTGIEIGAWVTLTNVPFHTFGEGSFDKGIKIIIPTEWALPFGSTSRYEVDLRGTQRDGGQALNNATLLYDQTQTSSYGDLQRQWPHVFQ